MSFLAFEVEILHLQKYIHELFHLYVTEIENVKLKKKKKSISRIGQKKVYSKLCFSNLINLEIIVNYSIDCCNIL